jgi:2-alkyl-3-oxoalkanoate reductase
VLVTGASGFVGRHLVTELARRGVLVRAQGRRADRIPALAGLSPVVAALDQTAALAAAAEGCDAVVHCAALSSPWGRRADFVAANVDGTSALLRAAAQAGVRRFVHLSSPAVCFAGDDLVNVPETPPLLSGHLSAYGQTKAVAELLVHDAADTLETVILRPKAIYGPGDTAIVPRLLAAARAGRLRQIGDGRNLVDITYVDDVVASICCALTSTRAVGQVCTITGGEHVPLWDMIRELLRGTGLPSPSGSVPLAVALPVARGLELLAAVTGREPTLTRYSVAILARTQTYDITRARDLLGFVPQIRASIGVARTIDALRAAADIGR